MHSLSTEFREWAVAISGILGLLCRSRMIGFFCSSFVVSLVSENLCAEVYAHQMDTAYIAHACGRRTNDEMFYMLLSTIDRRHWVENINEPHSESLMVNERPADGLIVKLLSFRWRGRHCDARSIPI